jgi:hypothetical protein
MPVKRFPVVDRKRDGRKVRKDIVLADERLRISPRLATPTSPRPSGATSI